MVCCSASPWLFAVLSSSFWEEVAVELESGWSAWFRAVMEGAWPGVSVQAGLPGNCDWITLLLGAGLHMMSSPAAQPDAAEGTIQFSSSPDCKLLLLPWDQLWWPSDQSSHCSNWILTLLPKEKKYRSWISLPCGQRDCWRSVAWHCTWGMWWGTTSSNSRIRCQRESHIQFLHFCAWMNRLWLHKSSQLALLLKEAVVSSCCHLYWFSGAVCCGSIHAPLPPGKKGQRMELVLARWRVGETRRCHKHALPLNLHKRQCIFLPSLCSWRMRAAALIYSVVWINSVVWLGRTGFTQDWV